MASIPPKLKTAVISNERLQNLKNTFETKYGESPLFYVCAPGRVNLIEYPRSGLQEQFRDNYTGQHKSSVQEKLGGARLSGMSCVVDGTIPPSSGLSSSSALVCCAGLVTMEANQKSLSKVALAEICTKSERYIGTEGGGMDQSISFLAERGTAKLIEFQPLRATDVKLPDGAVFVISNCCVEMNKAASSHFNIRVAECRIATKMLAQARGLDSSRLLKLVQVQTELEASLEEMLALVDEVLHPEPYSREEICKKLGVTAEQFTSELLSANTQHVTHFKLHQRAKHVYGEASRVQAFKSACDSEPAQCVRLLGDLMNQSHASCRDLYECSCPELDTLVDTCLRSGAVGSRLTGAGWGGCAVSMVPVEKVEAFLRTVSEAFYLHDPRRAAMEKQSLFVSKPGGGAAVFLTE
ncbi:N-acetylgalactosamine kinase isoform 2-T2 [Spinachia spinachia]